MRGAGPGSLLVSVPVPYTPLMVSPVVATREEVTASRERGRFGVAGGFLIHALRSPYGFPSGRLTGRSDSKT